MLFQIIEGKISGEEAQAIDSRLQYVKELENTLEKIKNSKAVVETRCGYEYYGEDELTVELANLKSMVKDLQDMIQNRDSTIRAAEHLQREFQEIEKRCQKLRFYSQLAWGITLGVLGVFAVSKILGY